MTTLSPSAAAADRYRKSGENPHRQPGPSTAYSGVGKVKNAGVPLVAINTTAGTAAEMTSNAVIIDSARKVKEVIIDPNIIPDIAVDDASVMLEIPASVTPQPAWMP